MSERCSFPAESAVCPRCRGCHGLHDAPPTSAIQALATCCATVRQLGYPQIIKNYMWLNEVLWDFAFTSSLERNDWLWNLRNNYHQKQVLTEHIIIP